MDELMAELRQAFDRHHEAQMAHIKMLSDRSTGAEQVSASREALERADLEVICRARSLLAVWECRKLREELRGA